MPQQVMATTEQKPQSVQDDSALISLALERFNRCVESESATRRDALDDLRFSVGEQWPNEIKTQRDLDGRPCLTMNRLPQFIRQITNEQRQQRPAIQVNPAGNAATVDIAEVLSGMIRHIEVRSDAEIAYDTGFECATRTGFGYWRVLTEYVDGDTFDQELKIARIKNQFMVYFDPDSCEPDYSDAQFAFIFQDLGEEEYRGQYPKSHLASLEGAASVGDSARLWHGEDQIRVAEYFYVVKEKHTIAQLKDGSIVSDKHVVLATLDVVKTREVVEPTVKWAKINAVEALEKRDWPGKWIPIIPVLGDDQDVDGQRYLAGIVRDAKDPQRMYNYWISSATETIALAPKAPFVAAEGQLEGHEQEWADSNRKNLAVLLYKPKDVAGQAVPPPQRQSFEPPIQAMGVMIRQADNDLKATTGIYDASLGNKGPDESGKAILLRKKQADVSTMNFSDNMARSIRHTGRILLDLIPKIYDAPRIQRIVAVDGTADKAVVHNSSVSGMTNEQVGQDPELAAIGKVYDIGTGLYDVTVDVGPSYQTKRQESAESIMSLVNSYPSIMGIAGDLLVSSMDWPGAKQIAERLKRALPPSMLDDDDTDPKVQVQKLTAQLNQLMQQHQAVVQELNKASNVLLTKRLETESRERISAMSNQTQLIAAQVQIHGQGALQLLDNQLKTISSRLDLLHEHMTMEKEAELEQQTNAANSSLPTQPQPQQ